MRTASFNSALFVDCLAIITPPCLYGLGACLLAGKAVPALSGTEVGVGCAAVAAAWLAATITHFVRQRRYTSEYVLAWLDLHNRAGGRILAGEGQPAQVVPAVSLRPFLKRLPLPLLFVAACLSVPPMQAEAGRATAVVEPVLDRLADDIAASEEADALSANEAEALRQQIAEVRRLAETHPEAAMATLPSLPERLDAARAERLDAVADAMEKALDLAESARRGDHDASVGLDESLQRLAETAGGWEALPEALRQGGEGSGMDGAQFDKMLDALTQYGEAAAHNAAASRAGQHGGESGNGQASGAAEGAATERLASVREILDTMRMSSARAMGGPNGTPGMGGAGEAEASSAQGGDEGDGPGSGGVSRGPGSAPLWIGAPSDIAAEFEYRPLPPGDDSSPGALLRRERVMPKDDWQEKGEAPRRSAVDAPAVVRGGGGRVAPGPSGERAVTRYFDALQRGDER